MLANEARWTDTAAATRPPSVLARLRRSETAQTVTTHAIASVRRMTDAPFIGCAGVITPEPVTAGSGYFMTVTERLRETGDDSGRGHAAVHAGQEVSTQAYINDMRPAASSWPRVRKKTGSFYYHRDRHASHYVKVMLLDETPARLVRHRRWASHEEASRRASADDGIGSGTGVPVKAIS
jgi:hypothetical protein